MNKNFDKIQELLQIKAELSARLRLMPYDGTPEVKEIECKKYIYIRKRVAGQLRSQYVDIYSDDLYNLLLRNAKEARELKARIRKIEKELAEAGYQCLELDAEVLLNLDFARANIKSSIYDQAVLEGVATTFPQTEDIIENGIVSGVKASDVQKILNLKHAWEFVLDTDVISYKSDYAILCRIARLVNEGFFYDGGRIRTVPVSIGGTSYIPPIPEEAAVKNDISNIVASEVCAEDVAISLCLYCMKKQIFNDGNKRAAVIFANHYLISHAGGVMVIPERCVPEFKLMLVKFYEGREEQELREFMKNNCIRKFN